MKVFKLNNSKIGLLSAADSHWIGQIGKKCDCDYSWKGLSASLRYQQPPRGSLGMSGVCKAQNTGYTGWHVKRFCYMGCVFACFCADAERSATRETSRRSPSSSSSSTRLCQWSYARSTQLSITRQLTCSKRLSWWTTTAMTVSRNERFPSPKFQVMKVTTSFTPFDFNLLHLKWNTIFSCRGQWRDTDQQQDERRLIISSLTNLAIVIFNSFNLSHQILHLSWIREMQYTS